ncbi:MAG TPA: isoprenylcysteine carboxylmethyltransferase family protein [Candidatus Binataceae bacterium]|nr:isoprenylcysteine carboxylmethyltransferase family protein [Candidatus Binataceae bacterium]
MPASSSFASSRLFWILQSCGFCALIGLLLFGCAGRLDIAFFWAYLLVCLACFTVATCVIEPELFQERIRPGGQPLKVRYYALLLPPMAHWCIAGLDVGRFHWSDSVAPALQIVALAIFASALALITWAMRTNRFFSSIIRLQEDRGHQLVTGGPYRWVRHPGYIAGLMFCLSSGIALGSWLSLLPAVVCVPLLLNRTIAEDRFLKSNLKGYSAYADTVRYRLVPGIW